MKYYKVPFNQGFTLVEIMVVVVLIGMLTAIAVPRFIKLRQISQDTAVINNARQLANASQQYFLELGYTCVSLDDLAGSHAYVKNLEIVAAETYPRYFTAGEAITINGVGGARTITYSP